MFFFTGSMSKNQTTHFRAISMPDNFQYNFAKPFKHFTYEFSKNTGS